MFSRADMLKEWGKDGLYKGFSKANLRRRTAKANRKRHRQAAKSAIRDAVQTKGG